MHPLSFAWGQKTQCFPTLADQQASCPDWIPSGGIKPVMRTLIVLNYFESFESKAEKVFVLEVHHAVSVRS